jgi:cytochrome oxidase Cu insertion factor (SCO1/SenC/PrrC family)
MQRRNWKAWCRFSAAMLLAAVIVSPAPPQLKAATKKADDKPTPMKLKIGDIAPDFKLLAFDGKGLNEISLRDYRGKKNVALAFYVFAFTGG